MAFYRGANISQHDVTYECHYHYVAEITYYGNMRLVTYEWHHPYVAERTYYGKLERLG